LYQETHHLTHLLFGHSLQVLLLSYLLLLYCSPFKILKHHIATVKREEGDWVELEQVERFAFYERSKKAYPFNYPPSRPPFLPPSFCVSLKHKRYAIVATSETAIYANIILKKGVVKPKH
jgi:hypothetical protein